MIQLKKTVLLILCVILSFSTVALIPCANCGQGQTCVNGKCIRTSNDDDDDGGDRQGRGRGGRGRGRGRGGGGGQDRWSGVCKYNRDCIFPRRCILGRCINVNGDCASCGHHQKCVGGFCIPKGHQGCQSERDCKFNQDCIRGVCVKKVIVKTCQPPCRSDYFCSQLGQCLPLFPDKCFSDSQCVRPKKCVNNWCQLVFCNCNTNQKCLGNQCYPLDYCRTTSDCPYPNECRGNKCVSIVIDPCRLCTAFQKCINNRCYPRDYCRDSRDCTNLPYTQCFNNKCIVPFDPCSKCTIFQKCIDRQCYPRDYCRTNADCGNLDYTVCVGNKCIVRTPPPLGCIRDENCPRDYKCSGGICIKYTLPAFECQIDSQCRFPKKCIAGWCRFGCRFTCSAGFKCFNGECVALGFCQSNRDCPSNQECFYNFCRMKLVPVPFPLPECRRDQECPRRKVCDDGKCVRRNNACRKRCKPGYKCHNRMCVPDKDLCKSQADCKFWQNCQNGVCVKNIYPCAAICKAGHYCSSTQGCIPIPFDECRVEADCQLWQDCKNGKCVYDDDFENGCQHYCP